MALKLGKASGELIVGYQSVVRMIEAVRTIPFTRSALIWNDEARGASIVGKMPGWQCHMRAHCRRAHRRLNASHSGSERALR